MAAGQEHPSLQARETEEDAGRLSPFLSPSLERRVARGPREGDDVSDVGEARDEQQETFDPNAKPSPRCRTKETQVSVKAIVVRRQSPKPHRPATNNCSEGQHQ